MNVAIIGGGTMGNGIAQVFAMSGFSVHLVDQKQEFIDKALATIQKNLSRMVAKEKISEEDKSSAISHISTHLSVDDFAAEIDLVVEAVPEVKKKKKTVFQELNEKLAGDAIFASNTSSISIAKLAAISGRPERFIGMHFFNPVPVMKLVEVVKGLQTSEEVADTILKTSKKLGKTPVPVNDSPGFVSNRVLMPMINEAIFTVYEGVAEPEHVDEVMKLGMAHPMGPLRLADFIGLDVCLDILNVLYEGFKDPKYRPCPLLVQMVEAGKLGDKSWEGFYEH